MLFSYSLLPRAMRKIIHIDMDAFFASVEQRDNPALRGKPVAVGHADGRGVVAAASYEARRFGVRSAMSSARARRLCPELIFTECRFDVYKAVSAQIHDIFRQYTDIIEPISLDEAFLDVTENFPGIPLAIDIAREIKQKIRLQLNLVASAGVSYNKFLAKIASDYRKPDGLYVIAPQRASEFIASMPIETFWGVGPVTAARMHSLGIYTGADLRQFTLPDLRLHFGKMGPLFYNFARGIDNRPVEAYRERKSRGVETTFETDITAVDTLKEALRQLCLQLAERLSKAHFKGNMLTLKVKFADFSRLTRCISNIAIDNTAESMILPAEELLDKADIAGRPVRLLGLTVSRHSATEPFKENSRQLLLDFDN